MQYCCGNVAFLATIFQNCNNSIVILLQFQKSLQKKYITTIFPQHSLQVAIHIGKCLLNPLIFPLSIEKNMYAWLTCLQVYVMKDLSPHYRQGFCPEYMFGSSVVLTEKIMLHAALFFPSKR